MKFRTFFMAAAFVCISAFGTGTHARGAVDALASQIVDFVGSSASRPVAAPKEGTIEVGFSPKQGALDLVLKTINASRSTVDVMAYSFTSADVTRALLAATKRGVKVRLLVDREQNFKGNSQKSLAALSALQLAGAEVRSIDAYAIFHQKVVIADNQHLQTGSFNYSSAADLRNSENVLVLWNAPQVAKTYTAHFEHNWALGKVFTGR